MLPAGWPEYVCAELSCGRWLRQDPRFTSLEVAIRDWRLLDADRQFMAVIMIEPHIPAGLDGELIMRLDWTDIHRVAAMLGL